MITNYTTLQSTIASWLNRSDLTGSIPTFIQLAERRLLRDPRARNFGTVITPLAAGNPTNWLLQNHPDIYLYGALVESAPFLKDDERIPVWKMNLDERLNELGSSRLDPARVIDLTTYAGLQTTVAEFLDRPDLTAAAPVLIGLAEASFRRDYKLRRMVDTELLLEEEEVELPNDLLAVESWYYESAQHTDPIIIVPAERLSELTQRYAAMPRPYFAALLDGKARLAPQPHVPVTSRITYWQGIAPLTNAAPTNWLLQQHPDVYLYGALVQAAPYLKDDGRLLTWGERLANALAEVTAATQRKQWSGTLQVVRRRAIGG
jgi:hypothetical protein